MFAAYVVVAAVAAFLNGGSAGATLSRAPRVIALMDRIGVPQSWLTTLGLLKAAGAVGLLVGIAVPLVGQAAAVGLILFYVCAMYSHLRVRDYTFLLYFAGWFLLLAVTALTLRLASV